MNGSTQEQQLKVDGQATTQTLDDMRRAEQRSLLSSPSHPHHDLYSQVRVCLDKQDMGLKDYSGDQRDNLAAALALEARTGGLRSADHVVLSKDGSRAFVIEGELDSPSRRMSYVDTAQAAAQSMERSSQQLAQLNREQELQDQQRQDERQAERQAEHRGEREPSLARALFKDKD
ncbi:XVIPCD domain-containing protein [Lysobacter antibioticus]|uniref:XVIPCD domain-containing protein n=1 Tax=Lysobacter TaxID=68 RepID=UPI0004CFFE4C|nr:XVIPCD domain-containing protein [Lysobacter antibioticus]UZH43842.1 peptidoglycan-binding protein [Lysobacter antibioticus]